MQLLADRATEGLDMFKARELNDWLPSHPDCDEYAFDRAAAAIDSATLPLMATSLPSALRDRILFEAGWFFGMMENR